MTKVASLRSVFSKMDDYAWDLLEAEVHLETSPLVDGQTIANLLGLYMRGVEKLNSVQDPREEFFRNRVTTLMMRPNVVKSLSSPTKPTPSPTPTATSSSTSISPRPATCTPLKSTTPSTAIPDLAHKRQQIQMRLAYESSQASPEALTKLLTQHNDRLATINTTIETVIEKNNRSIEERIQKRKEKTVRTMRSARSEKNLFRDEGKRIAKVEVIIEEEGQNKKRKWSLEEKPKQGEQWGSKGRKASAQARRNLEQVF